MEKNGGDRFVESKRGKLYNEPPKEIESLDHDAADEKEPTEEELIAEIWTLMLFKDLKMN